MHEMSILYCISISIFLYKTVVCTVFKLGCFFVYSVGFLGWQKGAGLLVFTHHASSL